MLAARFFEGAINGGCKRGSGALVLLAFPLRIPVGMNESGTALMEVRGKLRSRLGIAARRPQRSHEW